MSYPRRSLLDAYKKSFYLTLQKMNKREEQIYLTFYLLKKDKKRTQLLSFSYC
jgi:hypothetical protein